MFTYYVLQLRFKLLFAVHIQHQATYNHCLSDISEPILATYGVNVFHNVRRKLQERNASCGSEIGLFRFAHSITWVLACTCSTVFDKQLWASESRLYHMADWTPSFKAWSSECWCKWIAMCRQFFRIGCASCNSQYRHDAIADHEVLWSLDISSAKITWSESPSIRSAQSYKTHLEHCR